MKNRTIWILRNMKQMKHKTKGNLASSRKLCMTSWNGPN